MGLFDYLDVDDDRFTCSEGHNLSGEEFQTKDLGETMGRADISGGRLTLDVGPCGRQSDADPITDTIEVYCDCSKCPAFIQAKTDNFIGMWCEFEVRVERGVVVEVKRISESTADWLASIKTKPHMADAEGPMPYEDATRIRMERLQRRYTTARTTPRRAEGE